MPRSTNYGRMAPGKTYVGIRPLLNKAIWDRVHKDLKDMIEYRIKEKGWAGYASIHEGYGIIAEEMHELLVEIQLDSIDTCADEAMDIAVGALWLYATILRERASVD